MKFDLLSFLIGGIVGMLLDFAGSFVTAHYLYKEHKEKRTGGSFRDSYNDNKGDDSDSDHK